MIKRALTLLIWEAWYCLVLVVLIGAATAVVVPLTRFVLRTLDSARLERLAQRIASADLIEAAAFSRPVDVKVSVRGDDMRRVIAAVSSSQRDRRSYPNIWGIKVIFWRGTNVLAEIKRSGDLFLVDGKQYRDSTGLLRELAVKPAYDLPHKAWKKQLMDSVATNNSPEATAAPPGS